VDVGQAGHGVQAAAADDADFCFRQKPSLRVNRDYTKCGLGSWPRSKPLTTEGTEKSLSFTGKNHDFFFLACGQLGAPCFGAYVASVT
jgi:hypothetical protein